MNAQDRKALNKLSEEIKLLIGKLDDCKGELETIKDGEREKFDNLSEGLQQAERGQAIEQAADALEELFSTFEEALGNLETLTDGLDNLE